MARRHHVIISDRWKGKKARKNLGQGRRGKRKIKGAS